MMQVHQTLAPTRTGKRLKTTMQEEKECHRRWAGKEEQEEGEEAEKREKERYGEETASNTIYRTQRVIICSSKISF